MWTITNSTPYAAERCWVRDKNGAEVWVVAVKATFVIAPDGSTQVADQQDKVCLSPVYRGEPGKTSLLYDSDLHHTKLNTDVVLNAHAYAPQGRPTKQIDVTVRVANVHKTLRVCGNRVWKPALIGLKLSEPEPFTKMPLIYERAFGGDDHTPGEAQHHTWNERNPVGVGFALRRENLIGERLPNVENPSALITTWTSRPDPVGFGPIAGHWKPRVHFAGTYDEKWAREWQPLLPRDFDERFYQCAPADQQATGYLGGGELVELSNLTPTGTLSFRLPRQTLGFKTDFDDGTSALHRCRLHTVIIEPDVPRVILVWHTHLPCHHKVLKLKTTNVILKRRLDAAKRDSAEAFV
jgi:hypothetical protein